MPSHHMGPPPTLLFVHHLTIIHVHGSQRGNNGQKSGGWDWERYRYTNQGGKYHGGKQGHCNLPPLPPPPPPPPPLPSGINNKAHTLHPCRMLIVVFVVMVAAVAITSSSSVVNLSFIVAAMHPSAQEGVHCIEPSLLSLPPLGQRHPQRHSSSTKREARCNCTLPSSLPEPMPPCPSSSNSHRTLSLCPLCHSLPTTCLWVVGVCWADRVQL